MRLIFTKVLIQSSQTRREQKLNDDDFLTSGAFLAISHQQELIIKENRGLR